MVARSGLHTPSVLGGLPEPGELPMGCGEEGQGIPAHPALPPGLALVREEAVCAQSLRLRKMSPEAEAEACPAQQGLLPLDSSSLNSLSPREPHFEVSLVLRPPGQGERRASSLGLPGGRGQGPDRAPELGSG